MANHITSCFQILGQMKQRKTFSLLIINPYNFPWGILFEKKGRFERIAPSQQRELMELVKISETSFDLQR